jgi:hypothetical protein
VTPRTLQAPLHHAKRASHARTPLGALVQFVCRGGYAARGFVYLSVGLVALLAAMGRTPEPESAQSSLIQAWADWPVGVALVWLTAIGLCGFAGWRVLQSVFDADREGNSPKALAKRAGQAVSGLVHAALAASLFGLLEAFDDIAEPDDQAETRAMVAAVLDWPHGGLLVMAAGLFVFGVGIGNILQGFTRDMCDRLTCKNEIERWAEPLGRVGYIARGLAFLPAGWLLAGAGFKARATEAGGLGGALEALSGQPGGSAILAVIAVGLMAFGLFAFVEARWRVIRAAEVVET